MKTETVNRRNPDGTVSKLITTAHGLFRRRIKRKTTHQGLVEEADSWVKAIVLHRQGPNCLKCDKPKPLQAAHILSKGANGAIRFDLTNVIGLCMPCHIFWAHRDPSGFTDWIDELFPGRRTALKLAASHHRKIDLKELICVLRDIARKEGVPK